MNKQTTLLLYVLVPVILVLSFILYRVSQPTQRYMICYPMGGVIDMINRIHASLEYAIRYNRTLVIDTRRNWFNDDIRRYIVMRWPSIYQGDLDALYRKLSRSRVYPRGVEAGIQKIDLRTDDNGEGWYAYAGKTKLTYALEGDHDEPVMVYSFYGADHPKYPICTFLQKCSFTPLVLDVYYERRRKLPSEYLSVHIRNTDYKSNVSEFIENNKSTLENRAIFLASDNKETIDRFKELYGKNLYTFAYIPPNNGKRIHEDYVRTPKESEVYNVDTIVDILLLASGNRFLFSHATSGFSKAALQIHDDKALLNRLLA